MSARAPLLLLVAALAGCFADGGFGPTTTTSTPTATSGAPTSDASTSQATTGPDPSTSTTGDPDLTTTGPPTTEADTSTTGGPGCAPPGVCQPGASEQLGPCEPCGTRVHTCQQDCQWGQETCVQSSQGCGYWVHDPGSATWDHIKPTGDAPTAPAIAAFDFSVDGQIAVLTANTFHVLTVANQQWFSPFPLLDLFPELPGPPLLAYALWNGDTNQYEITLVDNGTAYIYTFAGSPPAQLVMTVPCCGGWTNDVPDPGLPNVRDIFIDLANAHQWAVADITALCQLDNPTPLGPYAGWVLPGTVIVEDVGYCFNMVYQTSYGAFPPFAAPGAPPGELVGGTAVLDGRLFVFAGD